MNNILSELFNKENIEYFGILSKDDAKIINQSLFERKTPFAKSIITFLIPYYTGECNNRNISLYAISKDYHLYISEATERIIKELQKKYPNELFYGMGDHSPIDEVNAAAKLGMGVIGDNGCIINEKYGSYLFIAEIYTSLCLDTEIHEIEFCSHCGICKKHCPSSENCLSHLTQKKGELDESTVLLMKKHNTAWGCDICQTVCPKNRNVSNTPIKFFYCDRIETLSKDTLDAMSDAELSTRAYGWRKRKTIERNVNALE